MTTLSELIEVSKGYDAEKRNEVVHGYQMAFGAGLHLTTPTMADLELTDHAWGHLYEKLGPVVFGKGSTRRLPVDYLNALPDEVAAMLLNFHLGKANGHGFLVRTYKNNCRAVLGGRSPILDNTDCLETLQNVLSDPANDYPGSFFTRSNITPDNMLIRQCWINLHKEDPGNHGQLYAGVLMKNSEVGDGRIEVYGFGWNGGCENSTIFGEGISITHQYRTDRAESWLKTQILAAMIKIAGTLPEYAEKLWDAQYRKLPGLAAIIGELAQVHKWDTEFTTKVAAGSAGQETVLGLINGITFAARGEEDLDTQFRWEKLAGAYLMDDSGLFALAEKVAKDETADVIVR